MTDVYEGSLIRLFRRLEELLRQIAQAAKVMGSEELEQKFTAALELIRRDLGKWPPGRDAHARPLLS
jgi:ATP-dependent RNA helicase DOB1